MLEKNQNINIVLKGIRGIMQQKIKNLTQALKDFKFPSIEDVKKLSSYKAKTGVAGLWEDEHDFVEAVRQAHQKKCQNFIPISPYPVHGLEEAMDIKRSWIPWVTFIFGVTGCLFGLWFTYWTSAVSWPIMIGGKPFWSLPAFIPVIFELTILFAALSSIGALMFVCGMPHIEPPVIHPDLTSHKFAIFIPTTTDNNKSKMKDLLKQLGSKEILDTEF